MGRSDLIKLDTRGLLCPLPVLKLRKLINNIEKKEKIKLITDDPAAVIDVPHFCNEQGHKLLESCIGDGYNTFIISKSKN